MLNGYPPEYALRDYEISDDEIRNTLNELEKII